MSFSITRLIGNTLKVGPKSAWHQLMILGEVKAGTLVGTDAAGNQYFENKSELFVRERWVVPAKRSFDPSEIPADWHMWIHKIDSRSPAELGDLVARPKWLGAHTDNPTGRADAYKPYDTTTPKVEAWAPKVARRA
ncbi:NADH ubiquinone oxidoreductase subunit NDUFA12-domain-containing protein [Blastocladiella britannica]|nr:NADH ubiquinone oxidoreductase subunit NDUFA12-domain-containing protein [Blastocladiella britannica]